MLKQLLVNEPLHRWCLGGQPTPGQFEQRRLARPAYQLAVLDAFCGEEQQRRRVEARTAWRELGTGRKRLAAVSGGGEAAEWTWSGACRAEGQPPGGPVVTKPPEQGPGLAAQPDRSPQGEIRAEDQDRQRPPRDHGVLPGDTAGGCPVAGTV